MAITDVVQAVSVMNLARRTDRLEHITAECARWNIPFTRFEAHDHLYSSFSAMWWNAENFKREVKQMKANGVEAYLHLDDDTFFVEGFDTKFEQAWSEVPDNWDMVSLGQVYGSDTPVSKNVTRSWQSWGGHALIIRNTVYDLLVEEISGKVWGDIDVARLMPSICYYACKPALAKQLPGVSDLTGEFKQNDIWQ